MAGRIRHLTAQEIAIYDLLDPDLARRVRVIDIPFVPGGFAGITLRTWVCLAEPQPTTGTSTLLAHELVHVRQWAEQGVVMFSARYLRAFVAGLVHERSWRRAYRSIPAEVEARTDAAHWVRRRNLGR